MLYPVEVANTSVASNMAERRLSMVNIRRTKVKNIR